MSADSFRKRHPQNVPGPFYVDENCLDCDLCSETAPGIFLRDDGMGARYVARQPATSDELALVREALAGCPCEAILDDGHDHDWSVGPVVRATAAAEGEPKRTCRHCREKKHRWIRVPRRMAQAWSRHRRALFLTGLLLGAYPAWVLGYTWMHVFRSELQGGKNGPLDAYRHALASAVVSYTLGEGSVRFVTATMESGGKRSNRMDRHNNRIGAAIGATVESFADLEPAVRQRVHDGAAQTPDPDRITWLPREEWRDGRIW